MLLQSIGLSNGGFIKKTAANKPPLSRLSRELSLPGDSFNFYFNVLWQPGDLYARARRERSVTLSEERRVGIINGGELVQILDEDSHLTNIGDRQAAGLNDCLNILEALSGLAFGALGNSARLRIDG